MWPWNPRPWQVPHVIDDVNVRAWTCCGWQREHVTDRVILAECCTAWPAAAFLPLWQLAQREAGMRHTEWVMAWHLVHLGNPGVCATWWWNCLAFEWHVVHATLPACFCSPGWQEVHAPTLGLVVCTCSCSKMPVGLWQVVQTFVPTTLALWHLLQVCGCGGMFIPV